MLFCRIMFAKLYDRYLLVLSIIAVMPFIILAFFAVVIGYALHLVKTKLVWLAVDRKK